MKSIGIRELRQSASVVLRQVEKGVTFEITDRGRPVALLSPMPEASVLDRLRAAGDTVTPVGDLDELPGPLQLGAGETAPSRTLARLRADER
ncbi:MAG: type II toxin-antitoxin system prevent-host-death family antitoxin [Myxococcales bacterium]|nr:type II toxin-antitoxin system prevent-host-death family antitoxin [Myxococcales bacterium]